MVHFLSVLNLWASVEENEALHIKCVWAAVELPGQLGIQASYTSHCAWKLYFYGTERKMYLSA